MINLILNLFQNHKFLFLTNLKGFKIGLIIQMLLFLINFKFIFYQNFFSINYFKKLSII